MLVATIGCHVVHFVWQILESLRHISFHVLETILHLPHSLAHGPVHVSETVTHLLLNIGHSWHVANFLVEIGLRLRRLHLVVNLLDHLLAVSVLAGDNLALAILAYFFLTLLGGFLVFLTVSTHRGGIGRARRRGVGLSILAHSTFLGSLHHVLETVAEGWHCWEVIIESFETET